MGTFFGLGGKGGGLAPPVLTFVYHGGCAPCHETRPMVRALAARLPRLRYREVDLATGVQMPFPVATYPAFHLALPDGRAVYCEVADKLELATPEGLAGWIHVKAVRPFLPRATKRRPAR